MSGKILEYQYIDYRLKYITGMEYKKDEEVINWTHLQTTNFDKRNGGIYLFNV